MSEINELIEQEASSIPQEDYISILLHKMRARIAAITLFDRQDSKAKELEQLFDTVPIKYRDATNYLKALFESSEKDMMKMAQLVEKQEKRYEYRSNSWQTGHSFTHIWDIQAYAYDYYFFFKENCLPFDYFSDPKNYFCYYLRAILCSYSPIAPVHRNMGFSMSTDRRHYPLNEIDIDMLIKYTDPKSLRLWLKEYSVQLLEVESGIDIVLKYNNLCDNFSCFRIKYWVDQILNFSIIVCLLKLDNDNKKRILSAFTCMFNEVTKEVPSAGELLFECLDYLVKHLMVEDDAEIKGNLLDNMLDSNVYSAIAESKSSMLSNVVEKLSPYANIETINHLIDEIELIEDKHKKITKIVLLRHVLPMERYAEYLNTNLELINIESIFHLLVEKVLPYSESLFNRFIDTIKSEDKKRNENPGLRTYPDWLTASIEYCIILKLIGFNVNLALLEPYARCSEHLQFMINPSDFDYTRIDISNYMWQNFIYSKDYGEYFIIHKDELLTDNLKSLFEIGVETKDQQKIVYGLLLDNDELRGFGK